MRTPRQKEVIWTPELAYAVGLITTDGNLSPDGRHLTFVSNDQDLIETLKGCLGLKNKIVPKRSGYTGKMSSYKIQFGNVTLYKWLIGIGLMPNKSKKLGILVIPDEYFFHFLRGHLDGDGTIRKYQDPLYPTSTRLYMSFMSASLPHLERLDETIKKLLDISGRLRKVNGAYTLTFAKYNSVRLLDEMYPEASVPCLFRKLVIAGEFVGITPR